MPALSLSNINRRASCAHLTPSRQHRIRRQWPNAHYFRAYIYLYFCLPLRGRFLYPLGLEKHPAHRDGPADGRQNYAISKYSPRQVFQNPLNIYENRTKKLPNGTLSHKENLRRTSLTESQLASRLVKNPPFFFCQRSAPLNTSGFMGQYMGSFHLPWRPLRHDVSVNHLNYDHRGRKLRTYLAKSRSGRTTIYLLKPFVFLVQGRHNLARREFINIYTFLSLQIHSTTLSPA